MTAMAIWLMTMLSFQEIRVGQASRPAVLNISCQIGGSSEIVCEFADGLAAVSKRQSVCGAMADAID